MREESAHTPKTSEYIGKWGQSGHRYCAGGLGGTDKMVVSLVQTAAR